MFENDSITTLMAFVLMVLQGLWWFTTCKKPRKKRSNKTTNWVLYATQTGHAQQLAIDTAKQLSHDKNHWQALALDDWLNQHELVELNNTTTLFIVSTQGEGDPPDNAQQFYKKLCAHTESLQDLQFAILGLGDSYYQHFCGFAVNLHKQLSTLAGTSLFPACTVDNLKKQDIEQWQKHLNQAFTNTVNYQSSELPKLIKAKLVNRICENPESSADKLFSLTLQLGSVEEWAAGSFAEVLIPQEGGFIKRCYTIANVSTLKHPCNTLTLLIRQVSLPENPKHLSFGIGSGYLTQQLAIGKEIELSIKHNAMITLPKQATPLILIATGSGLAGVLAVLRQAKITWESNLSHHLIYGERHQTHDQPCRALLQQYQKSGLLKTVDYSFSQSPKAPYHYVQDALTGQPNTIQKAIAQGAIVYVCGSAKHLKETIPATLQTCLGEQVLRDLTANNRLMLDVY